MLGYTPESACLTRTLSSLTMHADGRGGEACPYQQFEGLAGPRVCRHAQWA